MDLVKKIEGINLPSVAEAVDCLEMEMLKEEQVPCPVYHRFSPGVYVREVNLPAGAVVIGHRQKTEHLNVFLKGRLSMLNDDGTVSEMVAPRIFTGKPGRKCVYTHETVVWLNIYPTTETDVETLEAMFLDKSDGWGSMQSAPVERVADREDFKRVLAEYDIDAETVRTRSENEKDQTPFPPGGYPVGVFDSAIDGKGLFATADIQGGYPIAPARIGELRTPAERYTNHAIAPNSVMRKVGPDVHLFALRDISGCKGGVIGDEITIDYRELFATHKGELCRV